MSNDIILNSPMCDYLRLGTFDNTSALEMKDIIEIGGVGGSVVKFAGFENYKGWYYEHAFWGEGMQRVGGSSYHHWLAHVSGRDADVFAHNCYTIEALQSSRIDAQITLRRDGKMPSIREIKDNVQKNGFKGGASPELIEKETATCYIGSYKSDRFVRIYDKFTDDGEPLIRFEVQLKRKFARAAWQDALRNGVDVTCEKIINERLHRLPKGHERDAFVEAMQGTATGEIVSDREVDTGLLNKREWARMSIMAMLKMAGTSYDNLRFVESLSTVLAYGLEDVRNEKR